jgi:formate dehydrogenase subunit gamma
MSENRTIVRFTLNERIQHIVAMIAFIMLFLSGFALKYSDSSVSGWLIRLLGGMENRSSVHYAGGILLIAVGVYHILYLLLTVRGRDQLRRLFFRTSDWKAFRVSFKHIFSSKRPDTPHGRFTTRQKFQFWLVMGGSLSMGVSGLLIWFHDETMSLFSKWFWDFLFIPPSHGVMLVFLVIVLWHLYDIHLREAFPMDNSWLSGRLSLERLKQEHSLEYQELMASGQIDGEEDEN